MKGRNDHPLRKWRNDNELRIEDLARKAKVAPSHISQIETGTRGASLTLALKLATLTSLPVETFVRKTVAA